jgi:hypothetical protein
MTIAAPNASPCWSGVWCAPDSAEVLWALGAAGRTVNALPRLHPWRLGDTKGSQRTILWAGTPETGDGVAVFTRTSQDPSLPLGDTRPGANTDAWLDSSGDLAAAVLSDVVSRFTPNPIHEPCWMGGMARLPGAWLPSLAVLPRQQRDFDDPGTSWSTESIDFAARRTVHAENTRYAADVLAPHVMALILDVVPDRVAVTIAGDAIHLWAKDSPETAGCPGLVQQLVTAACRIKEAIPSFVLIDHPDRSPEVEADQANKAEAATSYRTQRQLGRSTDPTMQRIYDRARAEWEARDVSSHS